MPISQNEKLFRNQRAHDLSILAELFDKIGIPSSYKIREACNQLKDFSRTKKVNPNDDVDYSFWGYSINALEIPFNVIPDDIWPKNLSPVSAYISIEVIGSASCWGKIVDPLKKLEFNIELEGYNSESKMHRICYHIDRHIDSKSKDPHPIYHMHFGGRNMRFQEANIGNTIFLDCPRIMFHPTELILGLDFVLSNFFPDYWKLLRQQSTYISLIQDYYNVLVKPFAHTLASKWSDYNHSSIEWHPDLLFPQLA